MRCYSARHTTAESATTTANEGEEDETHIEVKVAIKQETVEDHVEIRFVIVLETVVAPALQALLPAMLLAELPLVHDDVSIVDAVERHWSCRKGLSACSHRR